jgi:prolyl 4-hydroxylase
MISIWIVVLFFFILALITYNLKINKKIEEGFGFDNDPSQFIEPSIHPNFITKEDADYILEMAEYNYEDSIIVSYKADGIRKSQTYWLDKDDPIAKKIITKVCAIDGYSIEQSEDIQVVKYEPNGYYKEHHDSCCDNNEICRKFNKDGPRVLTMIIYLNNDFEGGETKFPNIDKKYTPEKYSGLLFYPMNKNGDKCHDNSLHAGMPVTSGQKYIANVWIREK